MIDFDKSDKMRKISGKVDEPNTDNWFSNDISSSFSKDFLRMTGFSKRQKRRKEKERNTCQTDDGKGLLVVTVNIWAMATARWTGGDNSYHQAFQLSSKTWPIKMEYLHEKMRNKLFRNMEVLWIIQNTDNEFNNDISFIRIARFFFKVQHRRK